MMKYRWTIAGVSALLLALLVGSWLAHARGPSSADDLLLLLPDGTRFSDPKVTVWLDAASEEGLHVVPVHDSDFVRPLFGRNQCAGVILPDSIHQRASDIFISAIHHFVADGGKLLLVYDAGTLSLEGRYARGDSRLSDLAGVNYGLYDTLRDNATMWSTVSGQREILQGMEIPPGKYYPFATADDVAQPSPTLGPEAQLRRYKFGDLDYPSFVTAGNYSGRMLLHSKAGVVAGENKFKKGSVLFVNLPLGYLKANTDGLLLHAFLKYFAEHTLSLPYLMPVPDGVGGLVMNWHIDSNAAIKPLQEINSWSLLKQGPYSIHITAGPDAHFIGDKKGFDVDHNPLSQSRILQYEALGHEIGSHGGWIHDYFAAHIDKDGQKDMEPFLELNKDSLERVTHEPDVEYSSPSGDQPPWVTKWLESHGFLAYYFTGDTGMGPTEGYRNGVREGQNIWAFPISHLDRAAAFEEMPDEGYSNAEVGRWLEALTNFAANHQAARLVYFHPPGILDYHDVVDQWMQQTARLRAEGHFRWYTMADLATFLNVRKQVKWKTSEADGTVTVDAAHPETLEHMAWRFPSDRFAEPVVVHGAAQVAKKENAWVVVAGSGKTLEFTSRAVNQ